MTAVTSRRLLPGHYAEIAGRLRLMAGALRSAIGAGVADSYLDHVDLLERSTSGGQARRFSITAELSVG